MSSAPGCWNPLQLIQWTSGKPHAFGDGLEEGALGMMRVWCHF